MTGFATIIFSGHAWWIPAIATSVLLALALVWAGRNSPTGRGVRIGCGLLKLAGIIVLAMILLEPLWVGQRAKPGANFFAVIADNSQSLQVKDVGEQQSRGEILHKALTDDEMRWQSTLEENFQVRRYTFDSRLQSSPDFGELNFNGSASSLASALKSAMERWRGQPIAGVLLFTDGNVTDIGEALPDLDGCPPIYPVIFGKDSEFPDLSLKKIGVSQTAFEDAPVTVNSEVGVTGFDGKEIVMRLKEVGVGSLPFGTNVAADAGLKFSSSSNVVVQLVQRARGTSDDLNFRFQIHPDGPGLHFYELETRTRDESESSNSSDSTSEATLANNRQMIMVDRGEEPFRVLYVTGRPNWEYKFLNRAIQEDPQVQLVGLVRVALREPKFDFKGRAGETSNPMFRGSGLEGEDTARYDQPVLVRLNTRDEFELRDGFPKTAEELFKYDAIIVAKMEADFFTHDQMSLVQRFVSERGGGFLMMGGMESFREGKYSGTQIGSMLPVYLDRPAEMATPPMMKLELTREGWLQPWTRLNQTESEEKARLEAMPPFDILNPVSDVKAGATVLATVSDPSGKVYPALVVQRFGLGRTGALMIGGMYEWGMQDELKQKDLAKSWRQLVRWLVSDVPPRTELTTEPSVNGDPSEVRLTVKVRDEEFKPLDNSTVRLTVRPVNSALLSDETNSDGMADTNYVTLTAEPSATTPGTYVATYIARERGAYSVDAIVTQPDGKIAGRAAAGWTSDPAAAEFRSLKPNHALLQTIAKRTGGEVVALNDLDNFVSRLPERRAPITETWTEPVWHKPLIFLFVICCFLAEWGIRRWKGLP